MIEVEEDQKFTEGNTQDLESTLLSVPSETDFLIVLLLQRLYDVNMAMLSYHNKELADAVYDAHERGETLNPTMYVPEVKNV